MGSLLVNVAIPAAQRKNERLFEPRMATGRHCHRPDLEVTRTPVCPRDSRRHFPHQAGKRESSHRAFFIGQFEVCCGTDRVPLLIAGQPDAGVPRG
jgi:hypothetical protein